MSALVLRDCRVLDGLGGPPVEGELWIAEGRIVAPGSVPVVGTESLGGAVVVAGLIDAHVHLCLDGSADPLAAFRAATSDSLARLMRANAEKTLRSGVTTVRDLGSPADLVVALRDAISSGTVPGPRILTSGPPITSLGGHLHEMGGGVRGRGGIRDAVKSLRGARVDLIKVMGTGGGSSPQTDPRACQFTDEEIVALVQEANAAGLAVACHAHADAGIRQALAAGAATIEHGSYASETSLRAMAERGVTFVPTLAPALLAAARHSMDGTRYPAERMAAIRERFEARCGAVRAAVELGVRVIAGTDAGVADTPHGEVVVEITALEGYGLSAEQALAASGREAAVALGLPDIGLLAPGGCADLIVLEANPLEDLNVLGQPLGVMQSGRWVIRPDV